MREGTKSPPPMKALKSKLLVYQAVQEAVKSYIIQHGLKEGDQLPPETELAQQLSVSRNSVREAVKALEALGILDSRPGMGLFVRAFSFDPILNNLAYGLLFDLKQITDVVEVRSHLESGMVEEAIARKTPEQIKQLRDLLETMRHAAQQSHYLVDADRAFHRTLFQNVSNQLVLSLLDIFWDVLQHMQKHPTDQDYSLILAPIDPINTHEAHVPIVDALEQGDATAMRVAVQRHYIGIKERLRRYNDDASKIDKKPTTN